MPKKLLLALSALPYSWLWLQFWHIALDAVFRRELDLDKSIYVVLGVAAVLFLLFIPMFLARLTADMISWKVFVLLNIVSLLVSYLLGEWCGFTFGLTVLWLVLLVLQCMVRFCYYKYKA